MGYVVGQKSKREVCKHEKYITLWSKLYPRFFKNTSNEWETCGRDVLQGHSFGGRDDAGDPDV